MGIFPGAWSRDYPAKGFEVLFEFLICALILSDYDYACGT